MASNLVVQVVWRHGIGSTYFQCSSNDTAKCLCQALLISDLSADNEWLLVLHATAVFALTLPCQLGHLSTIKPAV